MSTNDMLFGKGRGYVEEQHVQGVSNVYLQYFIANGLFFVILIALLFYFVLKGTDYEFFFAILAFNSTEVALKPITMLICVIALFYYRQYRLITQQDEDNYSV